MSAIHDKVNKIIFEQLGVKHEDVKPESSFIDDLGADSLDTVELVMALEEEFDVVFCVKPDATVSQLNDSCRTEVTGFSEGSINVFFLLIRIELKQLFRGVAQLLVGFIYTFWFFLSFISSLLE